MNHDLNDFEQFSSQHAEQAILGALLNRNALLDDVAFLRQEHFSDNANRLIFNVIRKQIANGKVADPLSVFDALHSANRADEVGGMPYINDVAMAFHGGSSVVQWAQILVDKHKLRSVRNVAVGLSEAVCRRGLSGDEAVEEAMKTLLLLEQDEQEQVYDGAALSAEVLDGVQKRFAGEGEDGIKTGFAGLGEVMPNGIERGQLVVVAGRTSMGKSAFANTLALNIARDHSVLTVSYEMTKKQLSRRSAATLGRIPQRFLQVGFNENDDDTWERLTVATDEMSKRRYSIAERVGRTSLSVASIARKHQRVHGLDVLVVDHLGLMRHETSRKSDNTASAIGETTRQLKQLAIDLDIVVVLLVQINRAGAGEVKMPALTDLRDSGRIEEDADVVMILHRDDYYREESKKTHDGFTRLNCAKVRDGEQKMVYLKFLGQFSLFEDWVGQIPTAQPVEQKPNRGFGYGQQRNVAA